MDKKYPEVPPGLCFALWLYYSRKMGIFQDLLFSFFDHAKASEILSQRLILQVFFQGGGDAVVVVA